MLFEPGTAPTHVHFITSGIASIIVQLPGSDPVEVGFVGLEGFPERTHLLGPQAGVAKCFMQLAGSAFCVDARKFQAAFLHNPTLLTRLHEYVQHETLVVAQLGACNRLHDVEARLARWLLMVYARVQDRELHLRQEFLCAMLGTTRSSVSLAVGSLQRSGLIQNRRGKLILADLQALQDVACECYPVINTLYQRLYN